MVDLSAMEALKESLAGDKVKYLKLGLGKHVIRLCPPPVGEPFPWKQVKVHKNIGPKDKKVIPDLTKDNPIQNEIDRLVGLGDPASLERAKKMRLQDTFYMFVIKRGEEAKGPQLWEATSKQIRALMAFFLDNQIDISDPHKGHDVTVEGNDSGKKYNGKPVADYTFGIKMKPSPILDPLPDWLTENLFERYRVGRFSDSDYMQAVLDGTEEEFLNQRRADREARRAAEQQEPAPSSAPQRNDSAVADALEKIKANRKKDPVSTVRKDLDNQLG